MASSAKSLEDMLASEVDAMVGEGSLEGQLSGHQPLPRDPAGLNHVNCSPLGPPLPSDPGSVSATASMTCSTPVQSIDTSTAKRLLITSSPSFPTLSAPSGPSPVSALLASSLPVNKSIIITPGSQSQPILTNHHQPNSALNSSQIHPHHPHHHPHQQQQQTPQQSQHHPHPTQGAPNQTTILTSLAGALPASGYINQVTNSQPVVNAMPGSVLQGNGGPLKPALAPGMPNGSSLTVVSSNPGHAISQPQTQQGHAGQSTGRPNMQLTANSIPISLSAIHPSHQLVITSSAPLGGGGGGSASVVSALNRPQGSVNMNMVNMAHSLNKPHALLLATSKDGQTMVVQTSSNSTANSAIGGDSGLGQALTLNHGHGISTTATVFTVTKPIQSHGASNQQQNILTQVVSNPNMMPQHVLLNVPSRPQGAPGQGLQGALGPGVQRALAPRMLHNVISGGPVRIAPQVITGGRHGAPGSIQIGQGINLPRGAFLIKTENGQFQLVNVGAGPATAGNTGFRLQVPVTGTGVNVTQGSPSQTIRAMAPHQMTVTLPASMANAIQRGTAQQVTQPLTIQTAAANNQAAAATPSQMSPNTAKKKCKNFLSTLIRLASDQPEQVATNVKNLIQGLIDGAIQPEDFTNQLQRELNSSPQPCLVPFLKKSLPYLRHSLMIREMTIEGVRPPPHGTVQLPPQPQAIPQIQIAQTAPRPPGPTTLRFLTTPGVNLATHLAQGGVLTTRPHHPTVVTTSHNTAAAAPTIPAITKTPSTPAPSKSKSSSAKSRSPAAAAKEKEKKSNFASLRDDDDINDVAAMGGVNLVEESQRILATNAEFVGAQIRSCKDENFLFTNPLQSRMNQIATKLNLEETSAEVVSLVSHAAQEYLKSLVEKLGIIAEHRLENIKNDSRYEVTQDVRGQVKFLEELDRLEKKRHEEQEREMLLRAAKSRSKLEDPEQLKLKQKAKEMQRAELEEARQREANETALLAIGPRKKMKMGSHGTPNSNTNNAFGSSSSNHLSLSSSPFTSSSSKGQIRRMKRVNIRDLQFLMEQERETVRSRMLFKAYAK